MDIRVQAYSFTPAVTTSRAVAAAVPSRPVAAVAPALPQPGQADRAKALAAAAFNAAPALAEAGSSLPPQSAAKGGVAFTSPPEPGQLVNILV